MRIFRNTLSALSELLFPRHCQACGGQSPDMRMQFGVCEACWAGLKYVGPSICSSCGKSLASPEADKSWQDFKCQDCRSAKRIPYDALRSLYRYDSPMREMIHLFKFEGMLPLGRELARQLGDALSGFPTMFGAVDLIVPVPLHRFRRFKRGFNQSEVIGRELSDKLEKPMDVKCLTRLENTPPQSSLKPEKRRGSLKGAFLADSEIIDGKTVLLVDDVVTTEATIRECAKVLKKEGAKKVLAVTVARAEMM